MIYRHLVTCILLLTSITINVTAFPPSSPAGGNYLALDGVNDYAVFDFKAFNVLLPKDTDEFTVEAWVYPTTPPDKNITALKHRIFFSIPLIYSHHYSRTWRFPMKTFINPFARNLQAHTIMSSGIYLYTINTSNTTSN